MERGLLLLVATLVVFAAGEVEGTNHLSFSNMTVNISRDGCGESKLCVAEPENCDPAENNMCFLATFATEARPPNGTALITELSGYSMDFIALGLTPDPPMNTTFFFCYVRNETLRFRTMEGNTTTLSPSEPRVAEIRGSRSGMRIECEFDILMFNISTYYSVLIVNGTFTNGTPTISTTLLSRGPLDLSNQSMVNATQPTNTTPPTNTTSAAGHLHATALLVLLSIPSLSALLAA